MKPGHKENLSLVVNLYGPKDVT